MIDISDIPTFLILHRERPHFSAENGEGCISFYINIERVHFVGDYSSFTICQDAAMKGGKRLLPPCNSRPSFGEIKSRSACGGLGWGCLRPGPCKLTLRQRYKEA